MLLCQRLHWEKSQAGLILHSSDTYMGIGGGGERWVGITAVNQYFRKTTVTVIRDKYSTDNPKNFHSEFFT